jgi:hypothetical protein
LFLLFKKKTLFLLQTEMQQQPGGQLGPVVGGRDAGITFKGIL